jgi:pyroglutamyl-peptidase
MQALVVGFEGFAGKMNPSGLIARTLNENSIDGLQVSGYEIPEDFYKLPGVVKRLVDKVAPDMVIGTGWDYISKIKVECIALNIQNSEFGEATIPDNYNHEPNGREVIQHGELALRSTLPADEIASKLRKKRIPAFVSYHAGTHCCNTVMYSAIYYAARKKRNAIAGFMHIPPISEMKIKRTGLLPMKLDEERKAIEIALRTCKDYLLKKP